MKRRIYQEEMEVTTKKNESPTDLAKKRKSRTTVKKDARNLTKEEG